MALSREGKDALSDHFRNKDLYDPAKDPEQEVSTFEPKGMFGGGAVMAGYADGGDVQLGDDAGDLANPTDLTPDIAKALGQADLSRHVDLPSQQPQEAGLVNGFGKTTATAPQIAAKAPAIAPEPGQGSTGMPTLNPEQELAFKSSLGAPGEPPAGTGKLAPDQMSELFAALSARPTVGQSAMSGLAGLADAIETGVARAGNPGFQKNITEQQQNQKQNLIAALEAKYKGQGLGLEKGRLAQQVAHETAEEGNTRRGQDLTAASAAAERGIQSSNQNRESGQAQRDSDLKIIQDYRAYLPGGPSEQAYDQAQARLKANTYGAPSGGQQQHVQAVAWAKSHPNDPRSATILKINGQ